MSIKPTEKRFVDISKQRLSTSSRLNTYNIFRITETNQYFLNHFRSFNVVNDIKNNDLYFDSHFALEDEWWDNISEQYYGTPYYWYFICILNDVVNPYEELISGMKIKVLKKSYLYEVFKNLKEISEL
jgi:hypothetical protein